MKVLPAALQAKLDSGVTTFAYCWRIARIDGVVQGFTEHDRNLVVNGETYLAASGFTAANIQESLGLAVNNSQTMGAISSTSISDDDLARGLYRNADFQMLLVDWTNPTIYAVVHAGSIGEIKQKGKAYTAELRGPAHELNQKTGRTLQYYCDARLGDGKCTVNLLNGAYTSNVTVVSGTAAKFTVTGLGARASDWATNGRIAFNSGPNDDVEREVKVHSIVGSTVYLEMWTPLPFAPQAGDTAVVKIGCDHTFPTCQSVFANGANYQGYPYMPGNDVLTRYPNSSDSAMDGGSLYGN
jgi:uncharacterized phage protein (TIGR02218 family)